MLMTVVFRVYQKGIEIKEVNSDNVAMANC